jgi:hypothetical protein
MAACSHRKGLFVCDDSIIADREDIGDQKWILLGFGWIFTDLLVLLYTCERSKSYLQVEISPFVFCSDEI